MTQLCNGAEYFAEKEDLLAFLFSVLRQHAHNRLLMAGDFNFLMPSEALSPSIPSFWGSKLSLLKAQVLRRATSTAVSLNSNVPDASVARKHLEISGS